MLPKKLSKDQLLGVLARMIEAVKADDSFDGSIEYHAEPEPGVFEVMGSFRIGNSEGQGGCVLIGEDDQAPTPLVQPELPQVPATSLCDLVKAIEDAERVRIEERRRREAIARESRDTDSRECDGKLEAILGDLQLVLRRASACPNYRLELSKDQQFGVRVFEDPYMHGVERLKLRVTKDDNGFYYGLEAIPQGFEFVGDDGIPTGSNKVGTRDLAHFKARLAEFLGKFLAHHEQEVES